MPDITGMYLVDIIQIIGMILIWGQLFAILWSWGKFSKAQERLKKQQTVRREHILHMQKEIVALEVICEIKPKSLRQEMALAIVVDLIKRSDMVALPVQKGPPN